jgi:4a-hydroxytetrahydrobiopterin dehydratase
MPEELHDKHCVPCEGGTPPLSASEATQLLKNISGWNLVEHTKIEKKFHFVDFKRALTFVNEVGDIAEFEGHHPDIDLHDWNKVLVTLSTHAAKGLTENDFIMAAKIDQIIKDEPELTS